MQNSSRTETRGQRGDRRLSLGWLVALLVVVPSTGLAQPSPRLIDLEPFDEMTLKDKGTVVKLVPIDLKPRRPVKDFKFKPEQKLRVRLLDKPDEQYEVEWQEIQDVLLYEEMLLKEANRLVDAKKFDEAYEYFVALEERSPQFPGVAAGYQRCLYLEAGTWNQQGDNVQALALLNEVHRRNPQYANLDRALGSVVDVLAQQHFAAGRFDAVRRLVGDLKAKFPSHEAVGRWEQRLIQNAQAALNQAKMFVSEDRMRQAHQAAMASIGSWPQLAGAKELLKSIHAKYPILTVGVGQLKYGNWAAARRRRLLERLLFEPVDYDATSVARYQSPLGQLNRDGENLLFAVKAEATWSSGQPITSSDVAQSLLQGERLLKSAKVKDAAHVEFVLPLGAANAEPLLQLPLHPWYKPASALMTTGGYTITTSTNRDSVFLASEKYFARQAAQPREIIERRITGAPNVIRALRSGEIVAYDRIAPWEVSRFQRVQDITVKAYAAPTVHMLVPNWHKPRMNRLEYRRAILYGINRDRILQQKILVEPDAERGSVVTGPFASGYAYDETIEPVSYDPRKMLALAELATAGDGNTPPGEKLVIAYPPTEVATRACQSIAQQLQLEGKGLKVELVEWNATAAATQPANWDLLYVEWNAWEPLADAFRLLGTNGLVQGGNAALEQSLLELSQASDFNAALSTLKKIHRLVHEDVTVIPLWQLTEFYAHRKTLQGIGNNLITLYQKIEHWQHPIE